MTCNPALSPTQARLYALLESGLNVSVDRLAKCLQGHDETWSKRDKQQRLGAVISGLNSKLADTGYRVIPGGPRASYRLTPT